jgi:hypothetical protein
VEPWAITVDAATAVAIIGGGFLAMVRVLRRIDKKFARFQEDWEGSPARPGVPARAGVMERLMVIEVVQSDTNVRIEDLSQQIKGRRR